MPSTPHTTVPPCAPTGFSELQSYGELELPGVYWVDMRFDGLEWSPVRTPEMPLHHGSRLDVQNVADFPQLDLHRARPVRMTVEVSSRTIIQVREREWRATYHARILDVCAPR